jgi:hypothetical protein
MILEYNYSNIITPRDHAIAKKKIDELFISGNYPKLAPKFQTYLNLYEYDEFKIFVSTFLDSCKSYLNYPIKKCRLNFWCYMDYRSNFLKKDYNDQWHNHSNAGPFTISGIYYMINPRNVGTEFKNFVIEKPQKHTWYLFPSNLDHRPPKVLSFRKRYTLGADFYLEN